MARRSLKPQLNQIRTWVRQGRTDAWIAHQLEVSVGDIRAFKSEHALVPDEDGNGDPALLATGADADEPDLRAEDDALVAAALEQEASEAPEEDADEDQEEGEGGEEPSRRRRRGRRGGRGRRRRRRPLEGTFDHGEEGYGLWLDPAVQDDPVYAEHWAGHRPVTVNVEADRIVITRKGEEDSAESESESDEEE